MADFNSGDGGLLETTKASLWPFINLYNMANADPRGDGIERNTAGSYSGKKLRPFNNKLSDYLGIQFGSIPKILLAILCYTYTVDMEAAAKGWDFSLDGWVARVFIRDLVLMLVVPGVWDYVLYFSPLKETLAPYKFNSKYPPIEQLIRDIGWTFSATVLASVQEVGLMYYWAGGHFKAAFFGAAPEGEKSVPVGPFFGTADNSVYSTPDVFGLGQIHFHQYTACFVVWTMSMLHWRIFHFWFIHRNMHPWRDRKNGLAQGDVGAFLYRWVHAHHHKSHNPTAFSGISMTPVESVAYLSAGLIPMMWRHGCHPWIHLYTKFDLIIGAQIGHDGFDAPGGGSYYHQLHHAHFECNYGDSLVPMDWLCGTFEDGSKWDKTSSAKAK